MNKFLIVLVGLATLTLSACSDMPSEEVPIEERSGVGVRTVDGAKEVAAESARAQSELDAKAAAAAQANASGTGAMGGDSASVVAAATSKVATPDGLQTHALPQDVGAMGTALEGSAAIGAGQNGSQKDLLKDPASLLSKRVITFDFDSTAIREEFRPLIEAHAAYLVHNKDAKVILQGHTDERGSREYNLALGQRRSESVQQALSLLGVDLKQLEAVSLGEEKPLAEGHDEAAWQQNRRAEIYYQGE